MDIPLTYEEYLRLKPLSPLCVKEYFFFYYITSPCPFFQDNLCSIYSNRPLICQIFPFLSKDLVVPECELLLSTYCPSIETLTIDDFIIGLNQNNLRNTHLINEFKKIPARKIQYICQHPSFLKKIDEIIYNIKNIDNLIQYYKEMIVLDCNELILHPERFEQFRLQYLSLLQKTH